MRGATIRYMADHGNAPGRPWYDHVIREIALRGWGKTELSERSGVSRTTIDRWEHGQMVPRPGPVNKVADVIGTDRRHAHELAGIIARVSAAPTAPSPVPPDLVRDVMRNRRLSEDEKADVLALIEKRLAQRAASGESSRGDEEAQRPRGPRSGDPGSGRAERGTA